MAQTFGEKLLKYPTALGRMVIVIINNVYCIPTYVVWMTMLIPLKHFHPHVYYKIEGLFFHWLLAVVSLWSYTAGYDIVEVGDDINECINKRTLVIANHQSTADVPLLMANFNAKENVLPNLMWIMDRLFKYTNFGIVSLIHQDFFIASGRKKRDESINALRNHIKTSFLKLDRKWMVLFPEGGFLRKRRAVSQRFAEKNNLPVLQHVTLPRVGAFKAIIDTMCVRNNENCTQGNNTIKSASVSEKLTSAPMPEDNKNNSSVSLSSTPESISNGDICGSNNKLNEMIASTVSNCLLEYVLDITIAYPNGIPLDLPNILHGWREPCKTYMLYRVYKVSEIPKEENELTQWLYDRFAEKNEFLENFYKFGKFRTDCQLKTALIQQDVLRFVLINLFFITSSYLHYQLFCVIYTYYNILICSIS